MNQNNQARTAQEAEDVLAEIRQLARNDTLALRCVNAARTSIADWRSGAFISGANRPHLDEQYAAINAGWAAVEAAAESLLRLFPADNDWWRRSVLEGIHVRGGSTKDEGDVWVAYEFVCDTHPEAAAVAYRMAVTYVAVFFACHYAHHPAMLHAARLTERLLNEAPKYTG